MACISIFANAEDIDLTAMSKDELEALRDRINEEIKTNHALTSSEQSKLDSTAKSFVEALFKQNDMTVSWAWIDYEHTRDWGYATMSTHFDAKNTDKQTTRYNTIDYWAVADMNDGSEQKVIAFTVPKEVIQLLGDGKIPANGLGDYVNDLWIHPSLK